MRPQDSRPEGVVFVFDGGVLEETDLVGMAFPDGAILSAGFPHRGRSTGQGKAAAG